MKMFNLSVYPTTSFKVSPFTPLVVDVSKAFRNISTKSVNVLHKLSLSLQNFTRSGSVTVLDLLNGQRVGQQHIYAPMALQVNCMPTGSHPIRFSNGRTPYITKQVIF